MIIPQRADVMCTSELPPINIACLFASHGDGRRNYFRPRRPGRDGKQKVHDQTDGALARLRERLRDWGELTEMKAALDATVRLPTAAAAPPSSRTPNPNWTKSGRGMQIYVYQHNGGDFQMSWPEVEALIRKHFAGWEGTWNVWTKMPVG
ncbi:hypothetical protein Hte_011101 [Hypoxylon texense]